MTELMINQARCAVDTHLFVTVASHHLGAAKGPKVRSDTCPGRGQQLGNQNIVPGFRPSQHLLHCLKAPRLVHQPFSPLWVSYVCVAWLYRPASLGEGFILRRSPS